LGAALGSLSWLNHISVSFVKRVLQLQTDWAESGVVIGIDDIKTARNFYVCARLLDDFDAASIAIDFRVQQIN
jgi:hypothetical protein